MDPARGDRGQPAERASLGAELGPRAAPSRIAQCGSCEPVALPAMHLRRRERHVDSSSICLLELTADQCCAVDQALAKTRPRAAWLDASPRRFNVRPMPLPSTSAAATARYTQSRIDRVAERRLDNDWLAARSTDAHTRAYVIGGELIV